MIEAFVEVEDSGPIIRIASGDREVTIYVKEETGVVLNGLTGGYGIEVKGSWPKFKEAIAKEVQGTKQEANYMIGQRVLLTQVGGKKEIGVVVPPENGHEADSAVWVHSPSLGYASAYSFGRVSALPNRQL